MSDLESVLAGLNEAQREAALALRGPVAILAGAGTGKTTTITHRIACQVRSGEFEPSQILAVTFTDKAAGELKRRLQALGVEGVEARTFHSAALSQLSRLWSSYTGEPLPEVLDHKAPLISSLANALPPPHKFLPRRELAGEIEWAKNRMIPPARYLDAARRPRAADPGGPDAPRLRRVRAAQDRDGAARLRGHARARAAPVRRAPRRRPRDPPALRRVHRRRVPGREPAPGRPARTLARRPRRPLRGRRRLPDDLRVHRRVARAPAGLHAPVPARDGRPPRGELPLDARGARARQPARHPPGRVPKDAPGDPALGTAAARARRTRRGGRGRRGRAGRAAAVSRGGGGARGDRGAVPDQRPLRALRGGLRRRGDPVPGTRRRVPAAAGPARGPAAAEAHRRRRRGRGRRGDHRPTRLRPRGRARRRRGGHAPVRPRPHAVTRGGVRARAPRRRRGGVRRRARTPVLHRAQRPRA